MKTITIVAAVAAMMLAAVPTSAMPQGVSY